MEIRGIFHRFNRYLRHLSANSLLMNHIKIIILLLFCFGNTVVFGQKAQFKKADKAYKAKNYSEAIPLYEEGLAIKDNLSRKTKLANSYRMINQLEKAATLFREIVRDPKAKSVTYFYLGESLMGAGNYDEAKYWFQQYHTKEPEDQKALLMIAACNQVKDVKSIFPDMGVIPFAHNSDVDDNAPIFWNNQILFSSDRNQGIKLLKQKSGVTGRDYIQIYSSTEGNNFDYSNPKSYSGKVNELNKNSSNITISQDGTRAIFSRNSKNANKKNTHTIQLFEMESTDGKKWKNVKEVDFSNNAYNFMHPALSPDGKTLFFVSDKGSGHGGTDIYVSTYKKNKWSRPVNLGPVINTDANEGFPFFDIDGKLFFCSKGHAGFGGFDIFFSTQNPETEQWDVPINVGTPVNSPSDDISIFIDQETRRALFTSSRDGDDDDIYLGWLDGIPNELKETEIVETAIESKVIVETPTVDPVVNTSTEVEAVETPAEIVIEKPTEIVEAPETTEVEIKAPEIVESEVESEAIIESPTADPVVNTTTEVEAVETPSEIVTETPTEIVEAPETTEVEIITPTTTPVETPEKPVEAPPAPSTDLVIEPTVVEEITETIEATDIDLPASPTAQPVQVSVTEEIIETATEVPPVTTDKIPTPEVVPETTVIETTESTEEVIKKEVKEEIPTVEKPTVPNTPKVAPPPKPTDEEVPAPPPIPSSENNPKGNSVSSTMIQRSSFSTLKKDLKKKRSTAGKIYRLKNISYDPGGYLVDKAHGAALNEVYKLMTKNKTITIKLASHTYSVGNDQTNLKLSKNRAKRAANYLVEKGIDAERIFAVGYGEEQILNHCTNGVACTQAQHAKNERLEIQIMDETH